MKLGTKHPTSEEKLILNLKEAQIKIPWSKEQAVSYDNSSLHPPALIIISIYWVLAMCRCYAKPFTGLLSFNKWGCEKEPSCPRQWAWDANPPDSVVITTPLHPLPEAHQPGTWACCGRPEACAGSALASVRWGHSAARPGLGPRPRLCGAGSRSAAARACWGPPSRRTRTQALRRQQDRRCGTWPGTHITFRVTFPGISEDSKSYFLSTEKEDTKEYTKNKNSPEVHHPKIATDKIFKYFPPAFFPVLFFFIQNQPLW